MSNDSLTAYKSAEQAIPEKMLRWHLYGAGLENMGLEGKPEIVDVPEYGEDELLVRQDACGLCFSDTKVIALGENHPRMTGRNLAENPVTLGHEVTVTVVGVGKNLIGQFKIGDRFVVQADIFYQGTSMAYGYVISGGLSEYSVIPKQILDGDEGCYLLPVHAGTGYVESALTEPWACVVSAYAQSHREGIKPGGQMLVIGSEEAFGTEYNWEKLLSAESKPGHILLHDVTGKALNGLLSKLNQLGISHSHQIKIDESVSEIDWSTLKSTTPGETGFDDILLLGNVAPEIIEGVSTILANHGIVNIVSSSTVSRSVKLDIGRIHYNWHFYLGTTGNDPSASYAESRTADLLPSGNAWFIGAGGPMGQMHVQRAVQHKNPPKYIVATDVDGERLQSVADRFGRMAEDRGIEFVTLNPKEMSAEEFDEKLKHYGGGNGYDDIISMVPVAALVEHGAAFLAEGGWFNIFAGVARGTMATLDVNQILKKRVRFIGSSGSSLADMRETLRRVEDNELSTNASLAAIGGMYAAKEGLQAVKEGWFPGKTLIFLHIHDLPLTPLAKLKETLPTVYSKLAEGQFWTEEAEQELLRLKIGSGSGA